MEANRAPFGAVSHQVLDEAETRIAGVARTDRVEFHDRPLVARGIALDPQEPGDPARVFIHEEQIVGPEGAERQAEEAEDADPRPADGQTQRPRVDVVLL